METGLPVILCTLQLKRHEKTKTLLGFAVCAIPYKYDQTSQRNDKQLREYHNGQVACHDVIQPEKSCQRMLG